MTDTSEESPSVRKAFCSTCGGERNCDTMGHYNQSNTEYDHHFSFSWSVDWYILQCRGCENTFVQTVASNSEDIDQGYDETGQEYSRWNETIEYWPAVSKRPQPTWLPEFATNELRPLQESLRELYGALNADLRTLAGIGIRTTFDVASGILGVDENIPFSQKMDALVSACHINGVDKRRLETVVEGGSASAHRGWSPTTAELMTMMDIVEQFLHDTIVVPRRRTRLDGEASKLNVPRRKPRAKDLAPNEQD